jgi:hypothetical protein
VEGGGSNLEDAERYQEILIMHFTSYAIFVISDYIPFLGFITRLQGTKEKMQNIADRIHKKLDEILDLKGREKPTVRRTSLICCWKHLLTMASAHWTMKPFAQ